MMSEPLVSIIMSTYNESIQELSKSIGSVIGQTYSNLEFIIVCDNPSNSEMVEYLSNIKNRKMQLLINNQNMGLVTSLNRALGVANGDYIVRMDADDICISTRIRDELLFLNQANCDLVGSYVELIDEHDNTIKPIMAFPEQHNQIQKYIRWGNCVCHPTWLVKREVYEKLDGYRNAPHCEDYDFLNRALLNGYRVGNLAKVELKYRIRQSGVSKSNAIPQYLLREHLAACYQHNTVPTENEIAIYLNSEGFISDLHRVNRYYEEKRAFKSGKMIERIKCIPIVCVNKFFWKDLYEKLTLLARER